MVEVTSNNFNDILCEFDHDIGKCLFYSIDCEYSALPSEFTTENSFFEDGHDRYRKLMKAVNNGLVIQIGITPFRYYRDLNHFKAHPYNFYVFPNQIGSLDASVVWKASTIEFLCDNHFNFSKVFYNGIPYINNVERKVILEHLKQGTLFNFIWWKLPYERIDRIRLTCEQIKNWAASCPFGSKTEVDCQPRNAGYNFVLTEEICRINKDVRATCKENKIVVIKIKPEEKDKFENENVERERIFLDSLEGFSKIYKILTASKKPLVGHNLFYDLLVMYEQFHDKLPGSYKDFKKNLNSLFPVIYDTKYLAFEVKLLKNEDIGDTSLAELFSSYQDSETVFHQPRVILDPPGIYSGVEGQQIHNAGWDSYMTGFIFLKMAAEVVHIERRQEYALNVTSMEMLTAVEKWKNLIHIARAKVSHLNLQGDDPSSKRPPLLHVSIIGKQSLQTNELDEAFKNYGPVHKRPLDQNAALIAVANFKCFKRILIDFKDSKEYRVEKYSLFHHHRGIRACLIAGVVFPVGIAVWYGLKPHIHFFM